MGWGPSRLLLSGKPPQDTVPDSLSVSQLQALISCPPATHSESAHILTVHAPTRSAGSPSPVPSPWEALLSTYTDQLPSQVTLGGHKLTQPQPFFSPTTALAAKKPTLLNSLSSSLYEEKVAQPEIDGSGDLKCKDSRAFLAIFASRLLASSKLREFFPLCLLSERRESKSSPGDISLVMRPFKIPEERKGRDEQEDQRREEKGCQGGKNHSPPPLLGGPHSPDLPVGSATVPSPLWQGAKIFHTFFQTYCTGKKRKRRTVRENFNLLPIKGRVTLIYSSRTQELSQIFHLGKTALFSSYPLLPCKQSPQQV